MCHGMGLTASRLTCSRSATAAAAAVALSWLPSLDLQSLRNRGSRRRGNGAGCCTRSTCSRSATEAAAAVAMGNRGSRRSGNGAGCCPRSTCSRSATEAAAAVAMELAAALARPTQTGSRSATEAAAAAVGMEPAAALLWFFEVARCLVRDTRQPLTRSRCSCEGAQCSCKCKWADARASRPTQRRAAMGAAGGTAPVHGITNASATAPAARLWRLHGRPRRARQQPGSREAIARPI